MKKYFFTIIVLFLTVFCILFPDIMINSAKSGILLWGKVILPSLFPFLIISNLITKTALPKLLGKLLNPIMRFLFNLPGSTSLALFLGMTGGYPIGAKIASDLVESKVISKNISDHLITFVNNSGPLFISGAVGIGLYNSKKIGLLLLLVHYLSALIVGIIFREKENLTDIKNEIDFTVVSLSNLGKTLNEAIKNALSSIFNIGGFIVLFSLISSILANTGILFVLSKFFFPTLSEETSYGILSGLLEVTTGINLISTIHISLLQKLIITSILIGFGGVCIHMQTLSIISKTNISIKNYFIGKTLQGLISGILTYLALVYTSFSKILTTPVSMSLTYQESNYNLFLNVLLGFSIFIVIFKILQLILRQKNN